MPNLGGGQGWGGGGGGVAKTKSTPEIGYKLPNSVVLYFVADGGRPNQFGGNCVRGLLQN